MSRRDVVAVRGQPLALARRSPKVELVLVLLARASISLLSDALPSSVSVTFLVLVYFKHAEVEEHICLYCQ